MRYFAILALERAILEERERIAVFRVQERVPVRSFQKKNFRNAFLRSSEIWNAFQERGTKFHSCPSLSRAKDITFNVFVWSC